MKNIEQVESQRLRLWLQKIAQEDNIVLLRFAASRSISPLNMVTADKPGLWPTVEVWEEMRRAVEKG